MKPMVDMVLPFFFNVVTRLGKSKPQYGTNYTGTTGYSRTYGYGTGYGTGMSTGTGMTTYQPKPLEPEEDEALDELLWQWGQTLGTMIGLREDCSLVLEDIK